MDASRTVKGFLYGITLVACQFIKAQKTTNYHAQLDSLGPVSFPLNMNDFTRVSSGFGYRIHPVYKKRNLHQGIDLVAQRGKPIYATANGIVTKACYEKGYGNHIVISHMQEIKTLYGHLWLYLVDLGQEILRGQLIGFVGDTGQVTGAHLHYEVWYNGNKLNPFEVWKYWLERDKN